MSHLPSFGYRFFSRLFSEFIQGEGSVLQKLLLRAYSYGKSGQFPVGTPSTDLAASDLKSQMSHCFQIILLGLHLSLRNLETLLPKGL